MEKEIWYRMRKEGILFFFLFVARPPQMSLRGCADSGLHMWASGRRQVPQGPDRRMGARGVLADAGQSHTHTLYPL